MSFEDRFPFAESLCDISKLFPILPKKIEFQSTLYVILLLTYSY